MTSFIAALVVSSGFYRQEELWGDWRFVRPSQILFGLLHCFLLANAVYNFRNATRNGIRWLIIDAYDEPDLDPFIGNDTIAPMCQTTTTDKFRINR